MNEDKARILKMLEDGKISADEAMKLLDALDRTESRPSERDLKRRWLHIRVEKDGRQTVNIKIPLALLKFGFKFAPQAARGKLMLARAERAKERAERARARADEIRTRVQDKLREKFGDEVEIDLGGVFDEVFSGLDEASGDGKFARRMHPGTHGVHAKLEGIFNGDTDLDLDKILQMAQDPEFDGKVLDVYDEDDGEHVIINLE